MVTDIETLWLNTSADQRLWILREAGWRTNKGTPTRVATKGANQSWEQLSPAVQNVLRQRLAQGQISI